MMKQKIPFWFLFFFSVPTQTKTRGAVFGDKEKFRKRKEPEGKKNKKTTILLKKNRTTQMMMVSTTA